MHGAIGGGLPTGVQEWMIPGNRPEDEWAELVTEELEAELHRAIRDGEVPGWTTLDDLWDDLEEVEAGLAGEAVSPGQIAEETMRRYIERREWEEDEDEKTVLFEPNATTDRESRLEAAMEVLEQFQLEDR